jgi:hypothetical protein
MRQRIKRMREALVQRLAEAGVKQDMSFILRQKGMFSYSGLTPPRCSACAASSASTASTRPHLRGGAERAQPRSGGRRHRHRHLTVPRDVDKTHES